MPSNISMEWKMQGKIDISKMGVYTVEARTYDKVISGQNYKLDRAMRA